MPAPAHHARLLALGLGVLVAALVLAALYASLMMPDDGFVLPGNPFARHAAEALDVPAFRLEEFLPGQAQKLSASEAEARNLASPLVTANPLPPPFQASWLSSAQLAEAGDCLARAIYFEANGEPPLGQMAVAQVILNRLRHPRFPKTVCGVVYQGSERVTGCQFTFTCDGSLARVPNPAGLARARGVAEAALHGAVSALAGQATHYHATYIVPVWAPEMGKVAIIGHHVFYRPPGFYGAYPSFAAAPQIAASPVSSQNFAPTFSLPGQMDGYRDSPRERAQAAVPGAEGEVLAGQANVPPANAPNPATSPPAPAGNPYFGGPNFGRNRRAGSSLALPSH